MKNNSQNAHKDDGKVHLPKEQRDAMHRRAMESSLNAMMKTTRSMDMPHRFSVTVPVSESSGFTSAKNRKVNAASTLSDSSRSKISALDPSFAKGTYDLTKQGIDVSERKYDNNASHQDDTADSNHYLNASIDFDPSEQIDVLIHTQVTLKSLGNVNHMLLIILNLKVTIVH